MIAHTAKQAKRSHGTSFGTLDINLHASRFLLMQKKTVYKYEQITQKKKQAYDFRRSKSQTNDLNFYIMKIDFSK